ncbi:MAG: hypothetical protein E5V77_01955 [Mesorhizobium sp.]|nr:MAG: hypothetical protein E5V77_01955 [Mesorhizobium sp.]
MRTYSHPVKSRLDSFVLISFTVARERRIQIATGRYATPAGVQHHLCEHAGCGKDAGWGFAKPKQAPHWFCFEHRGEGEQFL